MGAGPRDLAATLNSSVVGLLLAVLAAVGGRVEQRFGGGWSSLWAAAPGVAGRARGERADRRSDAI